MSVRWKAWLMLLVVGLVLPVAGSPLRFCIETRVVVDSTDGCSGCSDSTDCDCDEDGHAPEAPTCVVGMKLLPDATPQVDFALPSPVVMELLDVSLPSLVEVPTAGVVTFGASERGPPDPLPVYLRLKRLLL
jgi:hypothetical protein